MLLLQVIITIKFSSRTSTFSHEEDNNILIITENIMKLIILNLILLFGKYLNVLSSQRLVLNWRQILMCMSKGINIRAFLWGLHCKTVHMLMLKKYVIILLLLERRHAIMRKVKKIVKLFRLMFCYGLPCGFNVPSYFHEMMFLYLFRVPLKISTHYNITFVWE